MSHRREKSVGRGKILWALTLAALMLPKTYNVNATNPLGTFETGETGIKLCAVINNGNEDSLRFKVINSVGFSSDIVVPNNTCRLIQTVAANYTIRENMPQEYVLDSVTGGTVTADNTAFAATATGQYTVIYENTYSQKRFLHSSGTSTTNQGASQVEISFDPNGGTGTMSAQRFAINTATTLTANGFSRTDYAFNGWNTAADGSGTAYTDAQQVTLTTGGEITLYAQWLSTAPTVGNAFTTIESLVNQSQSPIDFRYGASVSYGNGNGVNTYTENNEDIYYFRGEVDNNNVVWGGYCWKILRTTATQGIKMVFNGTAVASGNAYTCTATDTQITVNNDTTFAFNLNPTSNGNSVADLGYMYGARITEQNNYAPSGTFTFSKAITRNGNSYTLDTSTNQSITGQWTSVYNSVPADYRYFCTDGTTTCDDTKIAYVTAGGSNDFYYYVIGGYNSIEDAVAGMFANTNDSNAKAIIDGWFEDANLDGHVANTYNYEDDLEDAVFCNDRTIENGTLKGMTEPYNQYSLFGYFASYTRNAVVTNNNFAPSLDCVANDSFTTDTTNGNGALDHKIGLITADELTLAGINTNDSTYSSTNFLNDGNTSWTMSPNYEGQIFKTVYVWNTTINDGGMANPDTDTNAGFRPVVSLKSTTNFAAGGDGTAANPYVVD